MKKVLLVSIALNFASDFVQCMENIENDYGMNVNNNSNMQSALEKTALLDVIKKNTQDLEHNNQLIEVIKTTDLYKVFIDLTNIRSRDCLYRINAKDKTVVSERNFENNLVLCSNQTFKAIMAKDNEDLVKFLNTLGDHIVYLSNKLKTCISDVKNVMDFIYMDYSNRFEKIKALQDSESCSSSIDLLQKDIQSDLAIVRSSVNSMHTLYMQLRSVIENIRFGVLHTYHHKDMGNSFEVFYGTLYCHNIDKFCKQALEADCKLKDTLMFSKDFYNVVYKAYEGIINKTPMNWWNFNNNAFDVTKHKSHISDACNLLVLNQLELQINEFKSSLSI